MGKLTKKILEEARRMMTAWTAANTEGDREYYLREIASFKGVDYRALERKLGTKKTKNSRKKIKIRR